MSDDKRLERIETKLDDIGDHLGQINVTLAAQHVSLKEHIRRTALLEQEMKPVKKHVYMVNGALKLLGVLALLATIIEGIIKLAGK